MASYNRYIPQQDGSYRRNRVTQPGPTEPTSSPVPPPDPPGGMGQSRETPMGDTVGTFLRRLIPRNFDTGDLFVVLLLLLMAADSQEEQNTALLTLVLYLFL